MKAVWKFELSVTDMQTVEMPKGAILLTVQGQYDSPMLWALVELGETQTEKRDFRLAGTGHPIEQENIVYVGTFQLHNGTFVAHLFEVRKPI